MSSFDFVNNDWSVISIFEMIIDFQFVPWISIGCAGIDRNTLAIRIICFTLKLCIRPRFQMWFESISCDQHALIWSWVLFLMFFFHMGINLSIAFNDIIPYCIATVASPILIIFIKKNSDGIISNESKWNITKLPYFNGNHWKEVRKKTFPS